MTKLDLGCSRKKKEGYIGIDIFDWSSIYSKEKFICGRIPNVLEKYKNNSVEELRAYHILEHISQKDVIHTMNEVYRILIPNGIFEINIPPTTGRGAFCDPTHVSFWNDKSWQYYDMTWCRELSESYGIKCDFQVLENRLLSEFDLHVILKKRG